ncbi:MAG: hypothetical protein AAF658_07440 [Myxococcota bacterium]
MTTEPPVIEIGGVSIALALNQGPASQYFEGLLERHRSEQTPQCIFEVLPRLELPRERKTVWSHGPLQVSESVDAWWVTGASTVARVGRSGASIALAEPASERSAGWDRASASAALSLLMRIHRRFYLHAATVEWCGHSVLIVGPSGVGKTTLAVLMALHGGRLQGDDSAFVTAERVWAVAHEVRIDPRSLESRRDLAGKIRRIDGVKGVLRDLGPHGGGVSADVLMFPTLAPIGGLSAERISSAGALLKLLGASPFATERRIPGVADQLTSLTDLANRCVSFRVSSGPDVLSAPQEELLRLKARLLEK